MLLIVLFGFPFFGSTKVINDGKAYNLIGIEFPEDITEHYKVGGGKVNFIHWIFSVHGIITLFFSSILIFIINKLGKLKKENEGIDLFDPKLKSEKLSYFVFLFCNWFMFCIFRVRNCDV